MTDHPTRPAIEAMAVRLRRHAKNSASSGWYSVEDEANEAAAMLLALMDRVEELERSQGPVTSPVISEEFGTGLMKAVREYFEETGYA